MIILPVLHSRKFKLLFSRAISTRTRFPNMYRSSESQEVRSPRMKLVLVEFGMVLNHSQVFNTSFPSNLASGAELQLQLVTMSRALTRFLLLV